MKKILILLMLNLILSCSKNFEYLTFTLPRNNPNDDYNNTIDNMNLNIQSYQVLCTEDGDNKISRGERFALAVTLKNTEKDTAFNVKASFLLANSYFENIGYSTNVPFGDVLPYKSSTNYYQLIPECISTIVLKTSNTAPDTATSPTKIKIENNEGIVWDRTLNINIVKTDINFDATNVDAIIVDNSDFDNYIEPGENVRYQLSLKRNLNFINLFLKELRFQRIDVSSPYVSVIRQPLTNIIDLENNTLVHYNFDYQGYRTNPTYVSYYYSFEILVSLSTPRGITIPYKIIMVDGYGNSWQINKNIIIN